MPNVEHEKAQQKAAEALLAIRAGDRIAAQNLYREAAALEAKAVERVAPGQTRTLGILAVSLVALQYKARMFDLAERSACMYLAHPKLGEGVRKQLRELIETVWDEQALVAEGRRYVDEEVVVSLRGGTVGSGTAPLSVAVQSQNGVSALLTRLAEWKGDFDFRRRGPPPIELQEAMQIRVTTAQVGSYRFSIKLTEPDQTELFKVGRVNPREVVTALMDFVAFAVEGTEADLETVLPHSEYRLAALELLRNVVPSGRTFSEMDLIQRGSSLENPRLLRMDKHARKRLGSAIRSSKLPVESEVSEVRGVLRGLHLDKHWLEIVDDGGEAMHLDTPKDMLDDVVGPMVNHRVVIRATSTQVGGKVKRLIRDIELEGDE